MTYVPNKRITYVLTAVLEASSTIVALDLGFGTGLEIEPVTYLHSLQPLRKTVIF